MKKYLHVISVGFQNNLQYRFNYLTRTLFSFIPLFAMLSLWRTIYTANGDGRPLSGYTEAQMIFYYLMVAVVDVFTAVNEDDWQIAADIREGNINQFLLKPVDYLWYRLCLFFSGRLAFILMAALPLGSTRLLAPAVMLNILGDAWYPNESDSQAEPDWHAVLAVPGASLHLYAKREARRARKMGHVTVTGQTLDDARAAANEVVRILRLPVRA